ncbi:MAG: prenyltransferase/squalene oxidase repeat-containing protein [Planctomycetota bacterium]|nr:prenyltransferase/squalene oxidase repeat-containing protein [Planctomycetota bacterium]
MRSGTLLMMSRGAVLAWAMLGAASGSAARQQGPLEVGPAGPDPGVRPDGTRSAESAPAENEIVPALEGAVSRGFRALAQMQSAEGHFEGMRTDRHVGISALAGIAFMADGNLPGRGDYAVNVERAIDFVLSSIAETGLIAEDTSHGPMYGHGFAALFLGEAYGMIQGGPDTARSSRMYEGLVKACRLIVETQNDEGGWRYNPVPHDADISVTICQIMALRSARNAGIDIPKRTIDRAVEYVRACQNPDGGFRYQMMSGSSAWPRTAAGVASLYYAGVYQDQALDRGLGYLTENAFPNRGLGQGSHYFYGHYYAVQAMYLAGGEQWDRWWPAIRDELIAMQRPDGSWDDSYAGPAYGTAMALIVLQMPKRYLPIFQR